MNDPRCGTYAGWNAHKHRGERPCRLCQHAANDYMRRYRRRKQRVRKGLGWPL